MENISNQSKSAKQFADKCCQTDPVFIFSVDEDISEHVQVKLVKKGYTRVDEEIHVVHENASDKDNDGEEDILVQDDISRIAKVENLREQVTEEVNDKDRDSDMKDNSILNGETQEQEVKDTQAGSEDPNNEEFEEWIEGSETQIIHYTEEGKDHVGTESHENEGGERMEGSDDIPGSGSEKQRGVIDHVETAKNEMIEEFQNGEPIETTDFKCQHCAKTFTDNYLLSWHWESIFMKKEETWKCIKGCDKSFSSAKYANPPEARKSLNSHVRACEGKIKSGPPLKCDHCSETFHDQDALNSHWDTICTVKCEHCSKSFKGMDAMHAMVLLKLHWEDILRENETWNCPNVCGKVFKSGRFSSSSRMKATFQIHINNCNGPRICDKCGKQFDPENSRNRAWKRHLERCHQVKKKQVGKNITCNICGKKFKFLSILKSHAIGCSK